MDPEACYLAVKSRDRRFDGVFYTAVRTTGIYCRPSCPARTPAVGNVTFHRSAAAAQAAGYRACKRCLPDATPGSPEWDVAADVAGRAMRLIGDGVVDREGVPGLAAALGYTPRHLHRLLLQTMGAGPLALARSRRAQLARSLLDTTHLPAADVAFAAGFASVRQFNDTIREVYAATPTQLRQGTAKRQRPAPTAEPPGAITLRLGVRAPFAGAALFGFLATRAVPGVELADAATQIYARTLRLPHGPGIVRLQLADQRAADGLVEARFWLHDHRDIAAASERVRRLLDADADPAAVADHFATDPILGRLALRWPGLRVPGHVDGTEVAVRAVLGQQVTVAAARTLAARLVAALGDPLPEALAQPGLDRLFPSADALADLDPSTLAMPQARARALTGLARALADGSVKLDRSRPRGEVRASLLALPGIGPWTADYLALRALGDPDVFLPTDIGTRDALRALATGGAGSGAGAALDPRQIAVLAEHWRPWRSYAQLYLWQALTLPVAKEADHVDGD
ncbi:MAG: AlkA N-terminal domain-containing protein [Nocardioides sp.]